MTCQHCNHQFCWRCQSNWSSGCNARRFCGPLSVIRSDVWGSVPVVRESAQVVGITVGSAVGVGLVGAAVGLGAATAAVVVGAGIPVVTVGGTFYAIYQGAKKIKKRYSKRKRMQGRSQTVESLDELSVDEVTDLRNELKWGIRVYYTSNGEHVGNNNGDSFMGIAGRLDEGIFIAYPDLDSRLNGSSPPVYIIQHGTPFDVVNRVAGWSMVEVNVPSAERAEILLDLISADVINQFGLSRGYASIRRLPKNRSFAVTKSVPESDIENYKYLREPTLALHEDLSFAQAYRPRNLSI